MCPKTFHIVLKCVEKMSNRVDKVLKTGLTKH